MYQNGDNTQPKLMTTHSYAISEGNSTTTLWDLVDSFKRGLLVKPPHQRELAWKERDIQDWYQTIRTTKQLSVGFITYQLFERGSWSTVYLNDGGNRVVVSARFYDECENYGLTKDEAEMMMRGISVGKVHWHHTDWREAVDEFVRANKGTGLTPYEINAYELRYIGDHVPKLFEKMHALIRQSEVVLSSVRDGREAEQKFRRADYALLLRYMDKEVLTLDYDVTGKGGFAGGSIEKRLREKIEGMPSSTLSEMIDGLIRWVQEEIALTQVSWREYTSKHAGHESLGKRPMSRTLLRWCIDIGIARRHLGLSLNDHRNWLSRMFEVTDGDAAIVILGQPRIVLALEHTSRLRAICKTIGCDEYGSQIQRETKRSRRKKGARQLPGYHNSHIQPYSTDGNGATLPEPALLNRERRASPMTPEERERIESAL